MRIPEIAIIPQAKIRQYLLIYRRRSDKSRFLARAGFLADNADELEQAIRQLARNHEAVIDGTNDYGTFYLVEGTLIGPKDTLAVITVWLHRKSDGEIQFITLKPAR